VHIVKSSNLVLILGATATAALITLAAYFGAQPPTPYTPGVVVADLDLAPNVPLVLEVEDGAIAPQDEQRQVFFALTNTGTRPATLIGAGGNCGMGACLQIEFSTPIVIPPGQTVQIPALLHIAPKATEFEATAPLFLDDGGTRQIVVTARSKGYVAPKPAS
jgi:hypothetical protein